MFDWKKFFSFFKNLEWGGANDVTYVRNDWLIATNSQSARAKSDFFRFVTSKNVNFFEIRVFISNKYLWIKFKKKIK